MAGFYPEHEGAGRERKRSFALRNIENEDGKLLRDPVLILVDSTLSSTPSC